MHLFFIAVAIAGVAVSEDGAGWTAIDPCVLSAGPPSLWEEEWACAPRTAVGEEDVSAWHCSVNTLFKTATFSGSLH